MKCTSIEVPGIDHFQLHEGLSDEDFILTQVGSCDSHVTSSMSHVILFYR